jgi:hypothetical protein
MLALIFTSITAVAQVAPGTPLDQALGGAKAVRAGARNAQYYAGLTKYTFIPPEVKVSAHYREPGRSDVNCTLATGNLSPAKGGLMFLGADQKPLDRTAWRPVKDDDTGLFFETEAYLKAGRRFPMVAGSVKSYQFENRKCARGHETEWWDADGNRWVNFVCDEWGEILNYQISASFAFASAEDASVQVSVHCSTTTKDGSRRITFGDFRASTMDAVEFEW